MSINITSVGTKICPVPNILNDRPGGKLTAENQFFNNVVILMRRSGADW